MGTLRGLLWEVEEAALPSLLGCPCTTGTALILGSNWVFLPGISVSLPLAVRSPGGNVDFMLQTHFYGM